MFEYYFRRISVVLFPIIFTLIIIGFTTDKFDDILYKKIQVENIQIKEYTGECGHMNRTVTFKDVNSNIEYTENFHKSYNTKSGYNSDYERLINKHIYYKNTVFAIIVSVIFIFSGIVTFVFFMFYIATKLSDDNEEDYILCDDIEKINKTNLLIFRRLLKFAGYDPNVLDDLYESNMHNISRYKIYSLKDIFNYNAKKLK